MQRFFLSFSAEDAPVAEFLCHTFNHLFQGHGQFFTSTGGLVSGDRWLERVKEEIAFADAVLVLLSRHSLLRPWLNIEVGAFWATDKTIHPLLHGGAQPEDLHRPLADFQALDINSRAGVTALVDLLTKRLGMAAPPLYDAHAISQHVSELDHTAVRTFESWQKLSEELERIPAEPSWEKLRTYKAQAELHTVSWRAISDTVLQINGYSDDSMLLHLHPPKPLNAKQFLVIKLSNSGASTSLEYGGFLKILFAGEVLYPYFKFHQHPRDSQFIAKADGHYLYELDGLPSGERSDLLLVFWRSAVNRLRLQLAFVD